MAKRIKKSNPPAEVEQEQEPKYYEVGETFEFMGKRYRVDEVVDGVFSCVGCGLKQIGGHCLNHDALECLPAHRKDHKDVIFREIADDKPTNAAVEPTDEPTAAETTAQRVKDMEDLKKQVNEATTSPIRDAFDIPLYKSFFFGGRWLMPVPNKKPSIHDTEYNPCEGCVFWKDFDFCFVANTKLKCAATFREDGKNVIFIEDPAHTPTPAKPVPMLDPKPEPLPKLGPKPDPVPTHADQIEQISQMIQDQQPYERFCGVYESPAQFFDQNKQMKLQSGDYIIIKTKFGNTAFSHKYSYDRDRERWRYDCLLAEERSVSTLPDPVPTTSDPQPEPLPNPEQPIVTDHGDEPAKREYHSSEKVIEPATKEAPALDDDSANWPIAIPRELYDRLDYLGMLPNDIRDHNVGASNYAEHTIQPWAIWLDYPELTSWDHDILKRILRTKATDPRIVDYEKIIHICRERIRQLKYLEAHAE